MRTEPYVKITRCDNGFLLEWCIGYDLEDDFTQTHITTVRARTRKSGMDVYKTKKEALKAAAERI